MHQEIWHEYKTPLIGVLILNFAILNSMISSEQPLEQSIFGVYGRNTGALTYLLLSVIFLSASTLKSKISLSKIVYAFVLVGVVNVFYGIWLQIFGDFIPWTNPYGGFLGTFGNPNFASSFLGIFASVTFGYFISNSRDKKRFLLALFVFGLTILVIIETKSIQGLLVVAAGLIFTTYLRLYFSKQRIFSIYFLFASIALAITTLVGIFGKGPFGFLYKKSISLRATYWQTGIDMGLDHPFSGVGMDSYGEWYRFYRPARALVDSPGPNTGSNSAHNVLIDLFSYGGFPLAVSYIFLNLIALISVIRILKRLDSFDFTFVALINIWALYSLQSLISINQIGLAVWGWLAPGALVAYDNIARHSKRKGRNQKEGGRNTASSDVVTGLTALIGLFIGLIISFPPLHSDQKWYSAYQARDANRLNSSLNSSFFNPIGAFRYTQSIDLFASSEMHELARLNALKAIKENPNYFDLWRVFYHLPNTSKSEKTLALENMKRLDPKNKNVIG